MNLQSILISYSNLILSSYKGISAVNHLENYILDIENWFNKNHEKNVPLVIKGDKNLGKKSLIYSWIKYHNSLRIDNKDIIIPFFSSKIGNNSNIIYAIYSILVKLRKKLNIKQKVELLEEKLRKYFYYWLDVCSRKIDKEVIFKGKIILIFESIENFLDYETELQSNIKFWLPKEFPKNVKVILTTSDEFQTISFLNKINSTFINIKNEKILDEDFEKIINIENKFEISDLNIHINIILKRLKNKYPDNNYIYFYNIFKLLNPENFNYNIVFNKRLLDKYLNIFKDFDIDESDNLKDLSDFIYYHIEFLNKKLDNINLKLILKILSLTYKGLTFEQIKYVTEHNEEDIWFIILIYKNLIFENNNHYISKNILINTMYSYYKLDDEEVKIIHLKIAKSLKESQASVRKLEEETFHLFYGKDYFNLKQIISKIENFLLLMNPNNKYDLCRYWQVLEKKGYDPVNEYIKTIESFDTHYTPREDELFKIIFQLSIFFKEFSDFENDFTPEFRHPRIKGKIGVNNNKDTILNKDNSTDFDEENYEYISQSFNQNIDINSKNSNYLDDIGLYKEINKLDLLYDQNKKIINNWENTKIHNSTGINKFKNYFLKLIEKKNKFNQELLKVKEKTIYDFEISEEDLKVEETQNKKGLDFVKKQKYLDGYKDPYTKKIEEINLKISGNKKINYYYYKRWIWVIFPWLCISANDKLNYSMFINKCYSSVTKYMSIKEENNLYLSTLKIVFDLKHKKIIILKTENFSKANIKMNPTMKKLNSKKIILPKLQNLEKLKNKINLKTERISNNKIINNFSTTNLRSKNILSKSKIISTTISQSKILEINVRKIITQNINQPKTNALSNLEREFKNNNILEINMLVKENNKLKKELDKLIYDNKNLSKNIEYSILWKENNKNDDNIGKNEILKRKKAETYRVQIEKRRIDLAKILNQKNRMKKIIDLCDINNNENKKWIIVLENITKNYKKLFDYESKDHKNIIKKVNDIQKYTDSYVSKFNENINLNYNLIEKYKESCIKKSNIDEQILETEELTEDYLLSKIQTNKAKIEEKNFFEEQNKQIIKNKEKIVKIIKKIENYEKLDKVYDFIFKDNELKNFNKCFKTTEFKKLVSNLENKRDYEFDLLQLKDRNDILKNKKLIVQRKLNEIKLSQNYKNLKKIENNAHTFEMNNEYKKNIKNLKRSIDKNSYLTELLIKKKLEIKNTLGSFCNITEYDNMEVNNDQIKGICDSFYKKINKLKSSMDYLDFEILLFNQLNIKKIKDN